MCCPKKSQSKEALPALPSPLPPLLPKSSTTIAEPKHERRAMTVSTAPSAATPPSATSKRLGRGHRSGWNVSKGRSCHDLFVDLVVHEYGRSIALLGGAIPYGGGASQLGSVGIGFRPCAENNNAQPVETQDVPGAVVAPEPGFSVCTWSMFEGRFTEKNASRASRNLGCVDQCRKAPSPDPIPRKTCKGAVLPSRAYHFVSSTTRCS